MIKKITYLMLFFPLHSFAQSLPANPEAILTIPINLTIAVPTCSVVVPDSVEFGTVLLTSINDGSIASKDVDINMNCPSGLPTKYDLSLDSAQTVATTDKHNGIIGSFNNDSIGYQVTWVSGSGPGVSPDANVILGYKYIDTNVTASEVYKVRLKPVKVSPTIKSGIASASLRVAVKVY